MISLVIGSWYWADTRRAFRNSCRMCGESGNEASARSSVPAHSCCAMSCPTETPLDPQASSEKPEGLMPNRRSFCPSLGIERIPPKGLEDWMMQQGKRHLLLEPGFGRRRDGDPSFFRGIKKEFDLWNIFKVK